MKNSGYKIVPGLNVSSRLARDYLDGREGALKFYSADYRNIGSYAEKAKAIGRYLDRRSIADILNSHVYTGDVRDSQKRVDEFVDRGGFVVVTGQQPVICGGPLFVLFKALTAIKLAERLENELGVPVLPVFWSAGEDHDFEEMAALSLPDRDDRIRTITLLERDVELNVSACLTFLEDSDITTISGLSETLPENNHSAAVMAKLNATYRNGQSLAFAFSELVGSMLGPYGLFVVNACNQMIKESSEPVIRKELLYWKDSYREYEKTCRALLADGYELQVHRGELETNLFFIEEHGFRDKIVIAGDDFQLKKSARKISREELLDIIVYEPRRISGGVLARPLTEACALGTLAYVAGPGEISYYAQIKSLYDLHELEMPVICPRFGGLVLETKISHLLDKLSLSPEQIQLDSEKLASMVAAKEEPLDRIIDNMQMLKREISGIIVNVGQDAELIDPTIGPIVSKSHSVLDKKLDRLERRIVAAYKNKNGIIRSQIARLKTHLGPASYPQERRTGFIYYLAKFGDSFIDSVLEVIDPFNPR